jgi:Zn-dependent peptidase ImmA (M78 family)
MALAPITGDVLGWALRDAGVETGALGAHLGTSGAVVRSWIEEDGQPTIGQLDKIASYLHRPRSFFFLPRPPDRTPLTAEFRTYQNSTSEPGPETVAGLQLAQRIQKTTAWVRERLDENPVSIPPRPTDGDNEHHAAVLRNWLYWNPQDALDGELSETAITKAFRTAMQDRGLLVLHLTLDPDRTRGFSLWHPTAPLLAVNTREGYRARYFSYAHELAHLSLGRAAVCGFKSANKGIERRCNEIAAALLMPSDTFTKYVRSKFGSRPIESLDEVKTIRNKFHVSLRAAAVRAESLGLAEPGLYARVDAVAEYTGKRGGSFTPGNERTRPVIRVDEYGREFVSTLVKAEDAQVLRRRQVAELLRVSDRELEQLKGLAFAGMDV